MNNLKKFQVFISSTYKDLIKEREEITKQILNNYHFPIGMEMFSSNDTSQWQVVQETIDTSDIYVVVVGYRYGSSVNGAGISFTEREFDYAVSKNIPLIAFVKKEDKKLLKSIDKLKSGLSPADKIKLNTIYETKYDLDQTEILRFRTKVMTNRVVTEFDSQSRIDIQSALNNQVSKLPLGGWIRHKNIHLYEPMIKSLELLGVNHIRSSKPTPRDDAEKVRLFKASRNIKIIQYNGSRFFEIFKEEIIEFLSRNDTSLQVLIADKESEFYNENSKMVSDTLDNHAANKNLIDYAKARLELYLTEAKERNPSIINESTKLQMRHYNTQMRSPIIIFDDMYCHLTLTYAPLESLQAFELEFVANEDQSGYLPTLVKNFDIIWQLVK